MKENILLILNVFVTVAGGLGVFLLGMKHLSEGLQAVAGRELRRFIFGRQRQPRFGR
jgi:Na+/phosphate symporter